MSRGARRKLPPEDEAALVAMYRETRSSRACAVAFGLSHQGVLNLVRRHGVEVRRGRDA